MSDRNKVANIFGLSIDTLYYVTIEFLWFIIWFYLNKQFFFQEVFKISFESMNFILIEHTSHNVTYCSYVHEIFFCDV